jgi:hypothetical protein
MMKPVTQPKAGSASTPFRRLCDQFLIGFHEGWSMFWSPFVALAREAKVIWASRVRDREGQ